VKHKSTSSGRIPFSHASWWVAVPFVLAMLGPAGDGAAAFELELSVGETAGAARVQAPVCGGIPLPKGAFDKNQAFAVFQDGKEVPAQVVPLVVEADGGLRWVLVDLQTDIEANAVQTFTLKATKPSARPASPLKVVEGADGVTVDTGAVRFTISKNEPFSLFSSVAVDGKPVVTGGEVSYHEYITDKRHTAGPPERIEVQDAGPMRATVRAEGSFQGDEETKARYIARITAWAGKTSVYVKYSLSNSNPDHYSYRLIRDSSIRLDLTEKPTATLLGAAEPMPAGAEAHLHQGLHARYPGACKAVAGGKEIWTQQGDLDRAEGWVLAQTGGGAVAVCDVYFADDPARRLAVHDGGLVLTGMTERFDGEEGAPYDFKYRPLFDCSHHSSEYVIDFAAPADGAALDAMARAARQPLHLLAPLAWYSSCEGLAVGRFGTVEDERRARELNGLPAPRGKGPPDPGYKMSRGRERTGTARAARRNGGTAPAVLLHSPVDLFCCGRLPTQKERTDG
jgi:hypothetical protein